MKLRGCIYPELKEKAENYLGREFTQTELRLYPYLTYVFVNNGKVERNKISDEERLILETLKSEGRIVREYPNYYYPTKEFWMFINEILTDSYVTLVEDIEEKKNEHSD